MTDQKDPLVRGQSAVMSLLAKLPMTQHSPESFVVDVAISLVTTYSPFLINANLLYSFFFWNDTF